jgi:hypothetical protein
MGHERLRDLNVAEVCQWCIAVEEQSRKALGTRVASELWLIGLSTYEDRKGHRGRWADLTNTLLAARGKDHPYATPVILLDLAKRLAKTI